MKSLNEKPFKYKYPDVFTDERLKWLESEGFEWLENDSYCDKLIDYPYEANCFQKRIYCNYSIGIYIFSNGIGVDFDYDCGGNSFAKFWKFEDYTFEDAYDKMVDCINEWRC